MNVDDVRLREFLKHSHGISISVPTNLGISIYTNCILLIHNEPDISLCGSIMETLLKPSSDKYHIECDVLTDETGSHLINHACYSGFQDAIMAYRTRDCLKGWRMSNCFFHSLYTIDYKEITFSLETDKISEPFELTLEP